MSLLSRLLTHLFPSPTPDAIRATELPPIPNAPKVERPSRMPCTRRNCEVCQALKSLPWKADER